MQSPDTEKEVDIVIPRKVKKTGRYQYHMISLLGVI